MVAVAPLLSGGCNKHSYRCVDPQLDVLILSVLLWRFPTNSVQTLVVYNSLAYTGGVASSLFLNKYWTFGCKQRMTSKEVGRFVISMSLEILSSSWLVWQQYFAPIYCLCHLMG